VFRALVTPSLPSRTTPAAAGRILDLTVIRGLGKLLGATRASSLGESLIPCAAHSRLVEQAADDCVELVSGGALVIEHEDAASLCWAKVRDIQEASAKVLARVSANELAGGYRTS
jgi:hypothetical protein